MGQIRHDGPTYVDLTNIVVRVSDGTDAGKAHAVLVDAHLDITSHYHRPARRTTRSRSGSCLSACACSWARRTGNRGTRSRFVGCCWGERADTGGVDSVQ